MSPPERQIHVTWLQTQHGHYKKPHANQIRKYHGKSGKRYEPDTLINSLLLANRVTNVRDLSEALKLSLRSACSRTMADLYIGQIENAKSILSMPSASTISRRRLTLDVSFMMIMRKVNGTQHWRFGLSDSSPQIKRGWYLQMHMSIRHGDVVSAWKTKCWLAQNVGVTFTAERKSRGQFLISWMDKHMCVPASIGWRRASLLHKVHAQVHSYAMECEGSIEGLRAFFGSFVSWTTDMGIESMQADIKGIFLSDLVPWLVPAVEQEQLSLDIPPLVPDKLVDNSPSAD